MADNIRFTLNGQAVEIGDVSPMTTLLDWLRDRRGLKGTKEGCAEGDCGACTVVLERADGANGVGREPMNACIALLGQMDGQALRTVEGLAGADGTPHAVQLAMAESDATQCGFCTPGFVMSAYAFAGEAPDPETIHDALAGNLCRCTGYRPIVEAMKKAAGATAVVAATTPTTLILRSERSERLEGWATNAVSVAHPSRRAKDGAPQDEGAFLTRRHSAAFGGTFFAPRSLDDVLKLRMEHPKAMLMAGATDLGLLASRARKPPEAIIHLGYVPELTAIGMDKKTIMLGAAASYASVMPVLIEAFPALRTYMARLGSRQIRTLGTIGGNIGTASPIGDMPPVLLALEASLRLVSVRGVRDLPLEDFFLDYRKTALAPGEVIQSISLPRLREGEVFFCDKVSKRRDQDISTVAAGYRLRLGYGRIEDARMGFGGMAAIPKRPRHAEAALLKDGFAAAAAALAQDFQPIDDWRGTGAYRLEVAGNLLRRLEMRVAGEPVELDAL